MYLQAIKPQSYKAFLFVLQLRDSIKQHNPTLNNGHSKQICLKIKRLFTKWLPLKCSQNQDQTKWGHLHRFNNVIYLQPSHCPWGWNYAAYQSLLKKVNANLSCFKSAMTKHTLRLRLVTSALTLDKLKIYAVVSFKYFLIKIVILKRFRRQICSCSIKVFFLVPNENST